MIAYKSVKSRGDGRLQAWFNLGDHHDLCLKLFHFSDPPAMVLAFPQAKIPISFQDSCGSLKVS